LSPAKANLISALQRRWEKERKGTRLGNYTWVLDMGSFEGYFHTAQMVRILLKQCRRDSEGIGNFRLCLNCKVLGIQVVLCFS